MGRRQGPLVGTPRDAHVVGVPPSTGAAPGRRAQEDRDTRDLVHMSVDTVSTLHPVRVGAVVPEVETCPCGRSRGSSDDPVVPKSSNEETRSQGVDTLLRSLAGYRVRVTLPFTYSVHPRPSAAHESHDVENRKREVTCVEGELKQERVEAVQNTDVKTTQGLWSGPGSGVLNKGT